MTDIIRLITQRNQTSTPKRVPRPQACRAPLSAISGIHKLWFFVPAWSVRLSVSPCSEEDHQFTTAPSKCLHQLVF